MDSMQTEYPNETTPETRLDSFHVYRAPFKYVDGHAIECGILVPRTIRPGRKHPVSVHFHGGGFVVGDGLYAGSFPNYFVPILHRNQAIAVLPNFRMTPEHTGQEMHEDYASFWEWFKAGGVERFFASQDIYLHIDYSRVLSTGISSGGHGALQSAFMRPKGDIAAVFVNYPQTDWLRRDPSQSTMGFPTAPEDVIDDHIAEVLRGTKPSFVSSTEGWDRCKVADALNKYNRFNDYYGTGKHLWPITNIENASNLPPTFVVHGDADTAVFIEDTYAIVDKARRLFPKTPVHLVTIPGGEHCFDMEYKEEDHPWLADLIKKVEAAWLSGDGARGSINRPYPAARL